MKFQVSRQAILYCLCIKRAILGCLGGSGHDLMGRAIEAHIRLLLSWILLGYSLPMPLPLHSLSLALILSQIIFQK